MTKHFVITPAERPRHYRLEGHIPVPCSMMDWAAQMSGVSRTVAQTKLKGANISTVFLGLDHSFSDEGPPLLFETMIFGGEHDQYQDRCTTWDEAEAMHQKAVKLVKGKT